MLYWTVNKPAFLPSIEILISFPELFAHQIFLKRYSGIKAVSISAHNMFRNARDSWRIDFQ